MFLRIDPNNGVPLGLQIGSGLRLLIATRRVAPGEQLPSARDLAADLRVNFHTVRKVYLDLEQEGLLESRRGLGTFVAATRPQAQGELRRVVRQHVEQLLTEIAGSDVEPDTVREWWLEEWERRSDTKRRRS